MGTDEQIYNFPVYLVITTKHGYPALELRRLTTDEKAIKLIIKRAYSNEPILVFPVFRDRLRATNTLQEKKILKYDFKKGEYKFLI